MRTSSQLFSDLVGAGPDEEGDDGNRDDGCHHRIAAGFADAFRASVQKEQGQSKDRHEGGPDDGVGKLDPAEADEKAEGWNGSNGDQRVAVNR